MFKEIIQYIKRYKSLLLYIIFGVATTIVNIVCYYICAHYFSFNTIMSNSIAWVGAVLFAYTTNRIWVFRSATEGFYGIMIEFMSFIVCRLLTGVLDIGIMFYTVDIMRCNDMVMKIFSNIIVIILNYVASKLVIFKQRHK